LAEFHTTAAEQLAFREELDMDLKTHNGAKFAHKRYPGLVFPNRDFKGRVAKKETETQSMSEQGDFAVRSGWKRRIRSP
jgi:hypothetical protein